MGKVLLTTDAVSLVGEIKVPGDKSISHRSIMFGAIAEGKTTVTNFLLGEDCLRTIACFEQLGVKIEQDAEKIVVHGVGIDGLKEPKEVLDVGNSGTTIRLLLGLLAGNSFHTCFIGDESIAKRPMTRVTIPLKQMGAKIDGRSEGELTPLAMRGGHLQGIHYKLPVASAQVKSAVLLAGLQAEGLTTIVEKEQTRDHTERMIRQFSGEIRTENDMIYLKGKQTLKGTDIHVPGDISSAAFFLVAGAIVPKAKIVLNNVGLNPTRTGIIDVMEQMGARLTIVENEDGAFEPIGQLTIESSPLQSTIISGKLIPRLIDELPIIALLATQATGTTVIKDAEELKVKETNRIDAVVTELKKLGADIEATEDGMIIRGKTPLRGGQTVSSYGDHRMGMMLAIAGLLCEEPIYLEQREAIDISYPTFFEDLHALVQVKSE